MKAIRVENRHRVTIALVDIWLLVLFVLSMSFIAASTYNPFIYFHF